MSSHQRRIQRRFQLRLKLIAIFAWIRRQALAILRARKDRPEPILTDSQRLVAAARKLPVRDSQYGYEGKALSRHVDNSHFYVGKDIYAGQIRALQAQLSAGLL